MCSVSWLTWQGSWLEEMYVVSARRQSHKPTWMSNEKRTASRGLWKDSRKLQGRGEHSSHTWLHNNLMDAPPLGSLA
jgi:hypothetical protein